MTQRRYLATGREGTSAELAPSELRSADELLDSLGERIFLGEERDGSVVVLGETAWDDRVAARFALECAQHALGDDDDVELPRGWTLGSVLDEVRAELERSGSEPAGSLGLLSSVAAVRRLKRAGHAVNELAFAAARDDERRDVDLLDDPAWTTLAAIGEAILASVEALRYLARPAHVAEREREQAATQEDPSDVRIHETPWGPISIGSERISSAIPACVSAGEAAERSRQAVKDASGEGPAALERSWQVELLEGLLSGAADDRH